LKRGPSFAVPPWNQFVFRLHYKDISLLHFGSQNTVVVSREFETIHSGCFYRRRRLSKVSFESDSNLFRIEANVFEQCRSSKSIVIPRSVRKLARDCAPIRLKRVRSV
jgi:hypothetical protein